MGTTMHTRVRREKTHHLGSVLFGYEEGINSGTIIFWNWIFTGHAIFGSHPEKYDIFFLIWRLFEILIVINLEQEIFS